MLGGFLVDAVDLPGQHQACQGSVIGASIVARLLTGRSRAQLAHAVFHAGHQFKRSKSKEEHGNAKARRIVHLQQVVQEVSRQLL